jgi:hypothetical protein
LAGGAAAIVLAASGLAATAPAPYVLGGVGCAAAPTNGSFYCFDGFGFNPFQAAVLDSSKFGPSGTVPVTVTTTALTTFAAGDLSGVNGIVIPWWFDGDAGANAASVKSFFLGGGDLFILTDDSSHDPVNAALGLPTIDTAGGAAKPTSGNAPLYNGPFGAASIVNQSFNIGRLDVATVLAKGGHVVGTDAAGNVAAAVWDRNEYAAGAGRLVIATDVDMIIDGSFIPGAAIYTPLNDNGRFALNATAFLANGGTIDGFAYDLIGVPSCTITPGGGGFYCGANGTLFSLKSALANPANFGPSGVVKRRVALTELDELTPATLARVKAVIVPWVFDPEASPYATNLRAYFLGGGNLWLLQDDPFHDPIGELLGIPTPTFTGVGSPRPTNGVAPIYDGPFGATADVGQLANVGTLDAADVSGHGGTVVGTADNGDNVVAVWLQNAYAPGAGRMVIATDVDSTHLSSYAPLNANGIWSLNTIAFLLADVTPPTITCAVNPATLWPPTGKQVGVVVSGAATDASGLNAASFGYTVIDEYGLVQPQGPVAIGGAGAYAVTVPLVSARNGNDRNGRTYQIIVAGRDGAGNAASCTTTVTVLHDQRR